MTSRLLTSVSVLAFVIASAIACSSSSSSSPSTEYAGSCKLLASRCHSSASELGRECHELGHAGDEGACGPKKDACLAECPEKAEESDAGGSASDAPDAADDAAHDAAANGVCALYCTCMTATCASEGGYPYADESACLAACNGFAADGRTCVAAACERAKTASDKAHECEHAGDPSTCH